MRKVVLALALVGGMALADPAPAAAHFSISFAFPGFAFFAADPFPRPAVLYPSPIYYGPAPVYGVTYYEPGFRYYVPGFGGHAWKHGHGWRRHDRGHWHDD